MKAITTSTSKVSPNNTFEVTFNVYNGPNNEELDLQDQVIVAAKEEDVPQLLREFLERRAFAKQEATNIPVGFEVTL